MWLFLAHLGVQCLRSVHEQFVVPRPLFRSSGEFLCLQDIRRASAVLCCNADCACILYSIGLVSAAGERAAELRDARR